MGLINFSKPKKIRSTEEHNRMHTSDSGVNGTYVPNMSDEDKQQWKGKYITGENERIEIRKTLHGIQLVIMVRKNPPLPYPEYQSDYRTWSPEKDKRVEDLRDKWREAKNNIKISMNGSLWMSFTDWDEIEAVIAEARELLTLNTDTILTIIKQ